MPDVEDGVYARKQLRSRAALIAWSHGRRFAMASRLAQELRPRRVLDYGCGDGSFLAMLLAAETPPEVAVGAEVADDLVRDCQRRLNRTGAQFVHVADLNELKGGFDVVFCMEVLEHVIEPRSVLEHIGRLLAPGGHLVISVPVETGVPLILKQAVRRVAGWRGIGDYPGTTPYRLSEWLPSLLAGARQHIERPTFQAPGGQPFHDHKGFNWMMLRNEIAQRFTLKRVLASPVSWLTPHLGTQAWFVAARREPAGD